MRLRQWIFLALHESRGSAGRLAFFVLCLSVGVAAVVAVAGLSQALDSGIQGQARELLAADLEVSSRRPIADEVASAIDRLDGARRTGVVELPSVVSKPLTAGSLRTPGPSTLCEIKAVGPGYPYYGEAVTDPVRPLSELLGPNRVLVGPELLTRLDLGVGDELRVGVRRLCDCRYRHGGTRQARGRIHLRPSSADVDGGRPQDGPHSVSEAASATEFWCAFPARRHLSRFVPLPGLIRAAVADPQFVEVETYLEAQPALRNALARVERFLGLVALV